MTVRALLWDRKAIQDPRFSIAIRLSSGKVSRFLQTGLRVQPDDWNASKGRVRQSCVHAHAFNSIISELVHKAELLSAQQPGLTPDQLRAALKSKGTGTLLSEAIADVLVKKVSFFASTTLISLKTVVADVRASLPACTLTGLSVADVITMREHLYARGCQQGTVRSRLRRLRFMYHHACGLAGIQPSEVFKGQVPAEPEVAPRFLTLPEIAAFRALSPQNYLLRLTRDAWLLSWYLGGMRVGDLCRLHHGLIQGTELDYGMGKTKRPQFAEVVPQALEIIDRYRGGALVLPLCIPPVDHKRIASADAMLNKRLKVLARMAGTEHALTMHWARHSFADLAEEAQIDIRLLQMIFGHKKLQHTVVYMQRFNRRKVSEAFGKISEMIG